MRAPSPDQPVAVDASRMPGACGGLREALGRMLGSLNWLSMKTGTTVECALVS
jgi:hypothetical protein